MSTNLYNSVQQQAIRYENVDVFNAFQAIICVTLQVYSTH